MQRVSEIPFQLEGSSPPVNIREVLEDKLPSFITQTIASVKDIDRAGKRKHSSLEYTGFDVSGDIKGDSSDSDTSSVSGFDDLLGSGDETLDL